MVWLLVPFPSIEPSIVPNVPTLTDHLLPIDKLLEPTINNVNKDSVDLANWREAQSYPVHLLLSLKEQDATTYLIGRRACHILLPEDQSVSRQHAQLIVTAQGLRLKDLSSRFGTFLITDLNAISGKPLSQWPWKQCKETLEIKQQVLVRFGMQSSIYSLECRPLSWCTSSIHTEERLSLLEAATCFQASIIETHWQSECTHLIISALRATAKALAALLHQRPVMKATFPVEIVNLLRQSWEQNLPIETISWPLGTFNANSKYTLDPIPPCDENSIIQGLNPLVWRLCSPPFRLGQNILIVAYVKVPVAQMLEIAGYAVWTPSQKEQQKPLLELLQNASRVILVQRDEPSDEEKQWFQKSVSKKLSSLPRLCWCHVKECILSKAIIMGSWQCLEREAIDKSTNHAVSKPAPIPSVVAEDFSLGQKATNSTTGFIVRHDSLIVTQNKTDTTKDSKIENVNNFKRFKQDVKQVPKTYLKLQPVTGSGTKRSLATVFDDLDDEQAPISSHSLTKSFIKTLDNDEDDTVLFRPKV